ncbi:MAG: hypothetical protein ACOCXC_03975 [Fibrobacterota bacterium]
MSDRHLEVVRFVELKSSLVFEIRFSRDEDGVCRKQSGNEHYTESVRIVSAVMETLSERIGPDLARISPISFHTNSKMSPVRLRIGGQLSPDQFCECIANRADMPRDAARAAILVLKDALNKEDVNKISESLPDDYLTLFSE